MNILSIALLVYSTLSQAVLWVLTHSEENLIETNCKLYTFQCCAIGMGLSVNLVTGY